jgi:DNA primase
MTDPVLDLIQKNNLAVQVSGQDYLIKCLNPDHEDTNPSLRIDKVTGSFHCFSCGFKGNLFKYYGIFTSHIPQKLVRLKERLQELKSFGRGLELPAGAVPWTRPFRDVSAQTLKEFEAFYTNVEKTLEDRICFPIKDITNKTVVFVARHTLSNGNPRYLNYPKGVTLPLFPAYAPQNTKSIVLVEGLFDFLNLYDKGLRNAVCCFGTNTLQKDTKQKLLPYRAQGVTHVYFMFDGDDAGQQAQQNLKPVIEAEGFIVELIKLPEDLDPGALDQETVTSIQEYIVQ